MSQPVDDDWEWVVPPESDSTAHYSGANLASGIAVGTRVSELRLENGLTVQDIEDFTGVCKADQLAIEAGLLDMSDEIAEQLAMAFNVSAESLKAA